MPIVFYQIPHNVHTAKSDKVKNIQYGTKYNNPPF